MAEVAEVFRILADDATGAGEAPISRIEGEVAAAKEGLIGFSFKDNSGNVILPQLTADGRISVSGESPGTPLDDFGQATPVSLNTDLTVATITLTVSTVYQIRFIAGDSGQPSIWRLEQTDDATQTDIFYFRTGVGAPQSNFVTDCLVITAGASGTQELNLIHQQLRGPLSDVQGGFCLLEQA